MNNTEARIARIRSGLRQIDLAQRVRVSPSLISLFESGFRDPSPELARELNSILGSRVYPEADEGGERS